MFSQELPLSIPLARPPPNERTAVPILTVAFLLHAEKNTIRTETVRGVGFNEFLQYTSFHKLLLIIYIISSLLPYNRLLNALFFFETPHKLAPLRVTLCS